MSCFTSCFKRKFIRNKSVSKASASASAGVIFILISRKYHLSNIKEEVLLIKILKLEKIQWL